MSNVDNQLADIAGELADKLERELMKSARDPFKRALWRLLGFRPTAEALQKFADKSPDRWAQAVSILAGLAGYEKGINVTLRTKPIEQMSDAELLEEAQKGMIAVAALARGRQGEVVEGEVLTPSLPAPISKGEQDGS